MIKTKHRSNSKLQSKLHNKTNKKSGKLYNKSNTLTNVKKSNIIRIFIEMLNLVKLFHWKTDSFSQHKATDELYESLNTNIDRFVEVLLGKGTDKGTNLSNSRIHMVNQRIQLIDQNLKTFKDKIYEYRAFLVDLTNILPKQDTDLISIRDDILADINKFLYLLTFK